MRSAIVLLLLIPIGAVVALWIIGSMMPAHHRAVASRSLRAGRERVWMLLTDVEGMAAWRTDVERFERLPDEGGLPGWLEHGRHRAMQLRVLTWQPLSHLVLRADAPGAPFRGTWTIELTGAGTETLVSITESGEVRNPAFRVVGRFVLGWDATMNKYLDDLDRALGE